MKGTYNERSQLKLEKIVVSAFQPKDTYNKNEFVNDIKSVVSTIQTKGTYNDKSINTEVFGCYYLSTEWRLQHEFIFTVVNESCFYLSNEWRLQLLNGMVVVW